MALQDLVRDFADLSCTSPPDDKKVKLEGLVAARRDP